MARNLVIAGLLVCAASALSSLALTVGDDDVGGSTNHPSPPNINFPPQFYVTTGTTIPFVGADPVAQTGAIYYDEINQRLRVDNFWLGNQRSFIVDINKERGYVLSNGQCTTLRLTGDLHRYGVPEGAVRAVDPVAVRGVPVLHYTAVEKEETIQLVDFFIRPMNLSAFSYDTESGVGVDEFDTTAAAQQDEAELDSATAAERRAATARAEERMKSDSGAFFVPWQIRSKRLRQRSIAPTPYTATDLPNWRFFGEPMDEVITAEDAANEFGDPRHRHTKDGKFVPQGAVEKLVEDVTVTVDFFNFVPSQPSPTIFEMPAVCADQPPKHEYSYNVNVHQAQRLLVDMSFNSRPGRKLMDHLWAAEQIRRVAGGSGKSLPASVDPAKTKDEL